MSSTLTSFANSQRAADEREVELREVRRGLEERISSIESEKVMDFYHWLFLFISIPYFCVLKTYHSALSVTVEKMTRINYAATIEIFDSDWFYTRGVFQGDALLEVEQG